MAYLKAHRGDTEVYDVVIVDAAGAPLDLDDVDEMWFTVVPDYDESPVIEKTLTGGGIAITSAVDGEAAITLDPADTEDLPRLVNYPFDIQVRITATQAIATAIRGRIRVSPDVTTTTT